MPASDEFRLEEGFLRLDRIHPIATNPAWLKRLHYALSDDAMWLLILWMRAYMGEELAGVDDALFEYRESRIESLKRRELI